MIQRDIREPRFSSEFNQSFFELMEQKAQIKLLKESQAVRTKETSLKELDDLGKKSAAGIYIDKQRWLRAEKELEAANIGFTHTLIALQRVEYKIDFLCKRLFEFFDEILFDVVNGYLSQTGYQGYLEKYKQLLADTHGLSCYQLPVVERIWSEIHRHIPAGTAAN